MMAPLQPAEETVWLRSDGIAICSVSGTPLQNREFNLRELKMEIWRRTCSETSAIAFVRELLRNGYASLPLLIPRRSLV